MTPRAGGVGRPRRSASSGRGDRTAHVYEALRELIVAGRLAPGTRVLEVEVAERFAVSRTPARGALQRLQQEGYIVTSNGSKQAGLIVSPLTREDGRDLFGVVGALEGRAARLAAALDLRVRARLAAELRRWNQDLLRVAQTERPDHQSIFDLDTTFHRRYVEAGAGPRLLAFHDVAKPQAERYVRLYISSLSDEIGTSVEEHELIIQAIDAGDGEAAQRNVESNWRNASERLSRVIERVGERGSWW
jgi:DNA-binding GntR family transcriptional regulator